MVQIESFGCSLALSSGFVMNRGENFAYEVFGELVVLHLVLNSFEVIGPFAQDK